MKAVFGALVGLVLACPVLAQTASSYDGLALAGSGSSHGESDANGIVTFSFDEDNDNGFSRNDWFIRGRIQANTFTGEIHVHFVPVETWKNLCPGQWDTSLPLTASWQEDGKKWVGSYRSPRITSECTYQYEQGQQIPLERHSSRATQVSAAFRPNLPPAVVTEKPSRLWILLSAFSAPTGTEVPLAVVVGGKNAPTVIADRDIPIQLKSGEQVSQVVIPKGASFQVTSVVSNVAGFVQLEASAPGLEPANDTLPICNDAPLNDFLFGYTRQEAPADGVTPIPITITFQNVETGMPTSGNQQKAIQVLSNGVGIWTVDGHTLLPSSSEIVDEKHCAIRREVVSSKAGAATVIVNFRQLSKSGTFKFVPYLDWAVFSWIIGGALAGASIRIWQRRRKGRTWTAVMMEFFIGCMAGVVVFLAFYVGLALWPTATLPVSFAADFLVGFIGGFLGSAGINLVVKMFTDRLKSGDRSNGHGKSSKDKKTEPAAAG